jgi:hypothetical protein
MNDRSGPPGAAEPLGSWTPQRREQLEWFRKTAPGLAEAYQAAVELVGATEFPGISQFLAHAMRDIMNRLPDALAAKAEWMDAAGALDRIRASWLRTGLLLSESLEDGTGNAPPVPEVAIPGALYREIRDVLRERGEAGDRSEEAATGVFRAILPAGSPVSLVLLGEWLEARRWAARKAHFNHDAPRRTEWLESVAMFERFEALMRGLIAPFFVVSRELDEILEDANS